MTEYTITISKNTLIMIMLLFLIGLVGLNQYLILSINSVIKTLITGRAIISQEGTVSQEGSDLVQQIYNEVVPKEGSPTDYGLTFSEQGLQTLVDYQLISLTGEDQQRYIKIGSSPDTACEYCCGIGERGALRDDGNIACGCAHNIALAGLIKFLIQQGYTDEQILEEIQRWKAYFFPRGYVIEVLEERGINPESVGLPTQRGGC